MFDIDETVDFYVYDETVDFDERVLNLSCLRVDDLMSSSSQGQTKEQPLPLGKKMGIFDHLNSNFCGNTFGAFEKNQNWSHDIRH